MCPIFLFNMNHMFSLSQGLRETKRQHKTFLTSLIFTLSPHRSILGMATIGHMMSQIMKSKVKTTDPVKLVTYKQFCAVPLDTSLGHISKLLDMDHFVLVVHNQRMGETACALSRYHIVVWCMSLST